jgi:hypothetical protein
MPQEVSSWPLMASTCDQIPVSSRGMYEGPSDTERDFFSE